MSGRAFIDDIFKRRLGPIYISLHRTRAVSLISDDSQWYDLYILFGKKLEVSFRWA